MLFKPLYYVNIKLPSTSVYAVTFEPKWYRLKFSGNFPLKHFNTAKHCFTYIFGKETSSFREFIRLTCSFSFRISFGKPAISYLLYNDHFLASICEYFKIIIGLMYFWFANKIFQRGNGMLCRQTSAADLLELSDNIECLLTKC